ncbi:hypothetical protein TNCT_537391 [Trichonephila clavata]|uniref:Uncharacterized protein n=1 Tax=Trichonephila clavata TaxID=2740835 RepID=A0A8X6LSQ5_TRICU|nr:hypothetical protein TNCT_537391 [Trichonephila clavata]
MYCKVEDQKNPTYKSLILQLKEQNVFPKVSKHFNKNVVYRNGGRMSEIFTNRAYGYKREIFTQEYDDISEVRRNGQELGGSKLNLDLEDSHCENEERHQCSLKIFEEYISFLGMYCKVEDQKNPTYKSLILQLKEQNVFPKVSKHFNKNVVYRNGGRMSEIFTNRMYCKVEDQKNPTCKEPHPLAKRAECVPESIETLQQECCIKKWRDACLKYSPTGMYCKVEDQKNPTYKSASSSS